MQGGLVLGTAPSGTVQLALDGKPVPMDEDSRFLIAFDRDAPPTATIVATLDDGRTVRQALTIAPRAWQIERINAPFRPTRDSAAFEALRAPELQAIAAARAAPSR